MRTRGIFRWILLVSLATCLAARESRADTTLTAQLTGDPRTTNPDGLVVDVTVTLTDAAPTIAAWLVDIVSPLHPDIKLDSFFFNLALGGSTVTFRNPAPDNPEGAGTKTWKLETPATNAVGSGSADFDYRVYDGAQLNEVNNLVSLAFELELSAGAWTPAMFTGASISIGDAQLGSMQLGAHLQSLSAAQGESTSGFAGSGGWAEGDPEDPPPNGTPVPEPATLLLAGAAGALLLRRRARA